MNYFGKSDTGRVRSANQDSFVIQNICQNAALCVVCDGMGGAKSGNVASENAVKVFVKKTLKYAAPMISDGSLHLTSDDACIILNDAALDANRAVWRKSLSSSAYQGMGTTLVAALVCGDTVYVINVGDSRLYLISNHSITQITHDHSYVQCLIDNGSLSVEDARTHPYRNRITRAVGISNELEPDIYSITLSKLESYYLLLCSDGLCGQLTPEELYEIIAADSEFDDADAELADKTDKLIAAANEAGGPDNITAVLLKYTSELPEGVSSDDEDAPDPDKSDDKPAAASLADNGSEEG